LAILCADYKEKKYEKECLEGRRKSEEEIDRILSKQKDLPFFKLKIDLETYTKIDSLLKKDIYLGIKYRSIWRETIESN
jgi:hypothetical protein